MTTNEIIFRLWKERYSEKQIRMKDVSNRDRAPNGTNPFKRGAEESKHPKERRTDTDAGRSGRISKNPKTV